MFPTALRRDIVVLLAIKAVLLAVLYFVFFSPAHERSFDGASLRGHLISSSQDRD